MEVLKSMNSCPCPMSGRLLVGLAGAVVGFIAARQLSRGPTRSEPRAYHSSDALLISDQTLPRYPIFRVAVTGGPCSGKSTCMAKVQSELAAIGFRVYIVPEVATLLMEGGCDMTCKTSEKRVAQQRVVLQTIMMLEDAMYQMARLDDAPAIILCDRGTMDGRAYCTEEEWDAIMRTTGYTLEELRDARYDAVLHLVTAAIGAEAFYSSETNAVRRESPAEAAELDLRTRDKWAGHRNISVIDNSTSFDEKVDRVVGFIKRLARVQVAESTLDAHTRAPKKTHVKQFAVAKVADKLPDDAELADVTVRVLKPHPQYYEEKVIRRKVGTSTLYFHRAELIERIDKNGHIVPNVVNVQISSEQYAKLVATRVDESKPVVTKTQTTFFWNHRSFTITKYWSPPALAKKVVLSAPYDITESEIPPFITLE